MKKYLTKKQRSIAFDKQLKKHALYYKTDWELYSRILIMQKKYLIELKNII